MKRLILSLLLTLSLYSQDYITVIGKDSTFKQDESNVIEEIKSEYSKKNYNKVIELVEKNYLLTKIDISYFEGFYSLEDLLAHCYETTDQINRGFEFLKSVNKNPDKENYIGYRFVEHLIDFALALKKTDYCLEVMKEREIKDSNLSSDYSDEPYNNDIYSLDYARVYSVKGMKEKSFQYIQKYLDRDYGDSKNRILIISEFTKYHSDPIFQSMMTENVEENRKKYERQAAERKKFEKTENYDLNEVIKSLESYKKVTNNETIGKNRDALIASDKIVFPSITKYRHELLKEIISNKEALYLRLNLSRMLLTLNDTTLSRNIIKEIQNDDYTDYTRQNTYLISQIIMFDKNLAKPMLLTMLNKEGNDLYLAQHSMRMSWFQVLRQLIGKMETYMQDDLYKLALEGNKKALIILASFQNPLTLQVIEKIYEQKSEIEKTELMNFAAILESPTAKTSLLKLKSYEANKSLSIRLDSLIESIKAPVETPRYAKKGIKITNSEMKSIFYNNMIKTFGMDVSFVKGTIFKTATKEDIPTLIKIREAVLSRFSDEAIYDSNTITIIIHWLRWHG